MENARYIILGLCDNCGYVGDKETSMSMAGGAYWCRSYRVEQNFSHLSEGSKSCKKIQKEILLRHPLDLAMII
jgi:hypothetical protein